MGMSAGFRARRERCGLMQCDVADACGVNIKTVKRWENPDWGEAPADAWAFLEAVEGARRAVVKQAEEAALRYGERGAVQLTYYRTQEQYDEHGRDEGPFGVANANAIAVADRLESMGFDVGWAYPDDADNVYHGGGVAYVVTARERVLRLVDGDIREMDVNPYADPEVVYDGHDLEEARAAVAEFVAENPCEFEEQGLSAVVSYHDLDGVAIDGEDEAESCPELCATTLNPEARGLLERYADAVDEIADELGW